MNTPYPIGTEVYLFAKNTPKIVVVRRAFVNYLGKGGFDALYEVEDEQGNKQLVNHDYLYKLVG